MRRNVELNDLHAKEEASVESSTTPVKRAAKIQVNEGDAWYAMTSFDLFQLLIVQEVPSCTIIEHPRIEWKSWT